MAGKGRVVGRGGGLWRGGQLHVFSSEVLSKSPCGMHCVAFTESVVTAESQEGNELGIRPRSLQASMDKKNLFVASEKYTIWRVVFGCNDFVKHVMRRTRAPTIPMESWFAALIFIEVGVRWEVFRPS